MNRIRPKAFALAGLLALSLAAPALVPAPVRAELAPAETIRPRPAPNRPPPGSAPEGPAPELSTTPPPAPAAPPPSPRDPNRGAVTNLPLPRFASLKGTEGNARRGPGRTHRIDWVFTRAGMPLRVTAEYENWRLVEDVDGAGGWMHYALLSGVRSVLVMVDMTPFHSLPDSRSAVVLKAEKGVIARILQCDADWCRLLVDGQRGWAQKSALWGVEAGEVID
jgi:SH3-like domain-containing protein